MKRMLLPALIFFFALFFRLYNLGTVPYGFHTDEVANTYLGRFVLTNGRNIYGNKPSLFYIDKFGDYPPAIPMYLSGLSSYLFGLNEFAARFPAALIGSLIIFPVFLLFELLRSRKSAIIASLIVVILPWHVVLSRASAEGIIGLTVCVWGIYLLFLSLRKNQLKYLYSAAILLLFSYLLYPSFRLLVPFIMLPFAFIAPTSKRRSYITMIIIVFLVTLTVSLTMWGRGRFDQTSFFTNPSNVAIIKNDLTALSNGDGHSSILIARMFHNKIIADTQVLVEQYLSYFSPEFLFIRGGLPIRYSVPHVGLLYLSFLIPLGCWMCMRNKSAGDRVSVYMGYLLAISVIPAAITSEDSPNIHRALFMIFPLLYFVTIIVSNLVTAASQRAKYIAYSVVAGFIVILSVELVYTGHEYFAHAGMIQPYLRSDGTKQLAQYLLENTSHYVGVVATTRSWLPIYYLFYKHDFSSSYIGKFSENLSIGSIDRITFSKDDCITQDKNYVANDTQWNNWLFVDDGNCKVALAPFTEIHQISRIDGTVAYRLYIIQ